MVIFLLIVYILPYLYIYIDFKQSENTKKNRKNFIKQIALQKDIDDEIEHELNIHDSV